MAGNAIFGEKLSLVSATTALIESYLRARGGALPGYVHAYNASAETVDVQPAINRLVPSAEDMDEDIVEELPTIHSVPVLWPRARGFELKGSLQPGDPVLIVCLDRDASIWRRSGTVSDPADARAGSWSSCVAIPGLVPVTNPFPSPVDAAALASKVDYLIASLKMVSPGTLSNTAAVVHAAFPNIGSPPVPGIPVPDPVPTTGSDKLGLDS